MSDYVETLREFFKRLPHISMSGLEDAEASLERLVADRDRLQGRVATLQKALDDRYAADLKAAKAIFAETGRTSGFPSVREVVAYHVAEVERLEGEVARLRARLFPEDCPPADQERDYLAGQCATLLRENDSLRYLGLHLRPGSHKAWGSGMRKIVICIIAVMTGAVASTIANHNKPADVIPIQLPEISVSGNLFVDDLRWSMLKVGAYVVDDTENPTMILADCDSDSQECLRRADRI